MRMSMRHFTRLTNGFSKKAENLQRALALNCMHYNFCRKHSSIRTTSAIRAGLTDRVWTLHDLANAGPHGWRASGVVIHRANARSD